MFDLDVHERQKEQALIRYHAVRAVSDQSQFYLFLHKAAFPRWCHIYKRGANFENSEYKQEFIIVLDPVFTTYYFGVAMVEAYQGQEETPAPPEGDPQLYNPLRDLNLDMEKIMEQLPGIKSIHYIIYLI